MSLVCGATNRGPTEGAPLPRQRAHPRIHRNKRIATEVSLARFQTNAAPFGPSTNKMFRDSNPWDVGTARYFQHLGSRPWPRPARALRFAQGLPDAGVSRDMMLTHLREIVAWTDVPVNADS